jgi:hypothetical protein
MKRLGAEIRLEGRLRVASLVVAAAFGIGGIAGLAVSPPQRFAFNVGGPADEMFAPVRASFAAGERVGVLVPGRNESEDQVRWFSAQYALAPAIVEPIRLSACARSVMDPGCRPERVERVAAVGVSPRAIGRVADALGLVPLQTAGPVVVLGRPAR